ncbi:MAG: hypothetical protein RRZ65_08535 [Tannerellaceae bacterium]
MKKTFSVLLLFLCVIGFISCSDDDDNPAYHLRLSENSCEVMQGRSVAIDLFTHENTTMDVANSDLIDVLYTWAGSNKAKIEIKGKQKGETDILVTDHETGESATIKVKVTEFPMPRLAVEKPKGNIFDVMNFYLDNGSQSINSNDLSAVCDSIVWTVDGLNGSFRVFEHGEGEGWAGSHLTLSWGHCFKYPGEYKTYLTAWKDNKSIFRHQLDISAADGKDFLVYKWSDIIKDSQAWGSYVDVLKSSPDLMTTYGLNGTVPFAEVRLFGGDWGQSYRALYDYFCKLYSAPTYIDEKDKKMWKLYDELFSEQKEYPAAYPVAIWVTERANIVLLLLDEATEYPGYLVYAEPNNPS